MGRVKILLMLAVAPFLWLSLTAQAQITLDNNGLKPYSEQTGYLSLSGYLRWQQTAKSIAPGEKTRVAYTDAIDRAMKLLPEHIGQATCQYGDYVVFCGASVVKQFPQYSDILDEYKKAIIENDTYMADYPYWTVCHIMAFDIIGEKERAIALYDQLKSSAKDGYWDGEAYHLGWYLYAAIVAGDDKLRDKTLAVLTESTEKDKEPNHYFTAYCMWKIYEKTKDEKYRKLFLSIMKSLKPFKEKYYEMGLTDGHMGMTLSAFSTAYAETSDKEYKVISTELAEILYKTQEKNGSWNESNIAYTIMPAEGLTQYLQILDK